MPKMRSTKLLFKEWLTEPQWRGKLENIIQEGVGAVGPLISFLPYGGVLKHRVAVAIGHVTAHLVETSMEEARNVIRRLMWHMNEESGNIGWGIPEAFGEVLAASEILAQEYHKILFSYIINTGRDDNYCDNNALRRSCFWAVGRLSEVRPKLCARQHTHIAAGLHDEDVICRGQAAWGLSHFPLESMDLPQLRRLAEEGRNELCEMFNGNNIYEKSVSQMAADTLFYGSTSGTSGRMDSEHDPMNEDSVDAVLADSAYLWSSSFDD